MQRSGGGVAQSFYRFADQPVRLRVAGPALAKILQMTFAHLRADDVSPDGPFGLCIDAWDRKHTGTGCPGVPFPPQRTDLLDEGLVTHYLNSAIVRYERGHYVNAIDRRAGQIFTCRGDGNNQALYERSKPFPNLLEVWYRDHGVQQLHAGLVARAGRGALLIGQSGSGKTTATLACALGGFDYLGDDHNGLQVAGDGTCWGHSYYNAARIGPDHLKHFPQLAPFEVPPHCKWDHKSLVWMSQVLPQGMARKCRITAVIMPRIVPQGPTRFRPASRVQTLLSLAPSTLRVPLTDSAHGFMKLTDFIARMPCFVMEMGPDVSEIPGCVEQILNQVASGAAQVA